MASQDTSSPSSTIQLTEKLTGVSSSLSTAPLSVISGAPVTPTEPLSVIPLTYVSDSTTIIRVTVPFQPLIPVITQTASASHHNSLDSGAIAGIVLSILAVITAVIVFLIMRMCRARSRARRAYNPYPWRERRQWMAGPIGLNKRDRTEHTGLTELGYRRDTKDHFPGHERLNQQQTASQVPDLGVESPTTPGFDAIPPVLVVDDNRGGYSSLGSPPHYHRRTTSDPFANPDSVL